MHFTFLPTQFYPVSARRDAQRSARGQVPAQEEWCVVLERATWQLDVGMDQYLLIPFLGGWKHIAYIIDNE